MDSNFLVKISFFMVKRQYLLDTWRILCRTPVELLSENKISIITNRLISFDRS